MERTRPALSDLFLRLNRFSSLCLSSYPMCFSQLTFLELLQQNYSVCDCFCFSSVRSSKTRHSTPRYSLPIAEEWGRIHLPNKTADPNPCCCVRSFNPKCTLKMDPQTFPKKQTLFPTRVFGHVKRDH